MTAERMARERALDERVACTEVVARIDALFDPAGCLGESEAYVARALARHPPRP